jgi:hypothetical protein
MKLVHGYVLSAALLVAPPLARAAAPWFIIVSGPQLKERLIVRWPPDPKFFDYASDVVRFESAFPWTNGLDIDPETLKGRPYIDFAMFWGQQWGKFLHDGGDPKTVREDQANQHCWFYPAFQSMPPLVEMGDIVEENRTGAVPPRYRLVDEKGLEMLKGFGVPVELRPEK